jgi:hypothetical protein
MQRYCRVCGFSGRRFEQQSHVLAFCVNNNKARRLRFDVHACISKFFPDRARDNRRNMPNSIHSIRVRKDAAGSTEYAWMDPTSINNENVIAGEGSDIFDWNVIRGNAPIDYLQPDQTYVVKVIGYESSAQKTTTAPLGF